MKPERKSFQSRNKRELNYSTNDPKLLGLNTSQMVGSPIFDIKVHPRLANEVGHHHSDHNSRKNSIERDQAEDEVVHNMRTITLYESKDKQP